MPGRGIEAFNAEMETLMAFYAEDVVIHPAPGWVEDGVSRGHEGMQRLGAVWSERVDDAGVRVHDVRDLQDRLLILAEFTGRDPDSGAEVSQPFGVINSDLRVDGRVGTVRFYLAWDDAIAAAGL